MRLALLLGLLIGLCSCSKENTTWETNLSIPLLRTTLGLTDLVGDLNLEADQNQRAVLNYEIDLFEFKVDTLVNIEADSISKSFSIAPLNQFTFNPGQFFFIGDDSFVIEGTTAELKEIILKSGQLKIRCTSTVDADLLLRVRFPKATKSGQSLNYSVIIPAGENGNTSSVLDFLDLMDYKLDLTGSNGFDVNVLNAEFDIQIALYEAPTVVYQADQVKFAISYENLEMDFARGYLGTAIYQFSETNTFIDFGILNEAVWSISKASLELNVSNGFGIDLQALLHHLQATNVSSSSTIGLNHPIVGGSINLGRASEWNNEIIPSTQTYLIDQGNSNVVDFLNFIGDSLMVDGQVKLNPFGNNANYNDWASSKSELSAMVKASIPLTLNLSNLFIEDTVQFEWTNNQSDILSAQIYLGAKNSFPANAHININALDEQGLILMDFNDYLLSDFNIINGSNGLNSAETMLTYDINEEAISLLKRARFLSISVQFITTNYPELVTFQMDNQIELIISADLKSRIAFE